MASSTVPVTMYNRLGVEAAKDAKFLADPLHEEARHPQMVPSLNAQTRTHLKFPLEREKKKRKRYERK